MDETGTVTEILRRAQGGDREALDHLFGLLYEELREIARGRLRRRPSHATLRTTALIHEAWVRMARGYCMFCSDANFLGPCRTFGRG